MKRFCLSDIANLCVIMGGRLSRMSDFYFCKQRTWYGDIYETHMVIYGDIYESQMVISQAYCSPKLISCLKLRRV